MVESPLPIRRFKVYSIPRLAVAFALVSPPALLAQRADADARLAAARALELCDAAAAAEDEAGADSSARAAEEAAAAWRRGAVPRPRGAATADRFAASARVAASARLDTRLTRFVHLSRGSLVLYLEGLNVAGRHNVVGYTYDAEYRSPDPVRTFFSERTLVLGAEAAF